MVLNRFRDAGEALLRPLARRLEGVGADRLSWASLGVALLAGLAFFSATPRDAWLLVVGAALVLANAVLDALDGIIARSTGSASPAGNFLDHALDRYADLFILAGLSFSSFGDLRFGLLAITGIFLTSYLGTQAEAVGLKRDYGGLLGRADRLVLLTVVPIITAALVYLQLPWWVAIRGPMAGTGPGRGEVITVIGGLLLLFGILGHVTAAQRFVRARRALLVREGRRVRRS
jgi:archaetidylinositol phosphate synthase